MKIDEMRNMTEEELRLQILESNRSLFEARCTHATNQLENTSIFGMLSNRIARLQTVLTEKSQPS